MSTNFYSGAFLISHVVHFSQNNYKNTILSLYVYIILLTHVFDYKNDTLMIEKSILVVRIAKYI